MDNSVYIINIPMVGYDIQKEIDVHMRDLSIHLINSICDSIDNDIDYVEIANIITPLQTIKLKSSKERFEETLSEYLKVLIQYEEYEVCAKAKKYIDKIKKEAV